MAGLFNVSDSLFGDGELFSSADSSLFVGLTKPPEVRMVSASKILSLIQSIRLKDSPPNDVTQIMQVRQHSPDLPAQATINHLYLVRSPLWDLWH